MLEQKSIAWRSVGCRLLPALLFLLVCLVSSEAGACPTCKQGLAENGPAAQAMATGYDFNALGDFGYLPEEPASEHFNVWHQSLALGTELTERMTMYNEWVGLYSTGLETEFSIGLYSIGVDYYVTDNFVIDVRVGVGLTQDSDDFFSGVGGGYRY
jgi:hypothetical protein